MIFIILVFTMLMIPTVGLLWYDQPEVTENKELAPVPVLWNEDSQLNKNYIQDAENYFLDHFAYRKELVAVNSFLYSEVFGVSSEDLVIKGRDGWLFFRASLGDYDGSKHMSDRGLHNIAATLALMQEYSEGMGKQFVFICAPNKNTLYPEYMPYYYKGTTTPHNWERLVPYLDDKNVNYVNLQTLFEEKNQILYHKGDSHWNNYGAALVQNEVLCNLNREHTDYSLLETETVSDFRGDIDKILYPIRGHYEEEYDYSAYMNYQYVSEKNVEAANIDTVCEDKNGSLLMYRDSFGNSLLPFFANEYGNATFKKNMPYYLDQMYYGDYDTCVYEIVERNLSRIKTFAPVMPAPLRSIEGEEQIYQSGDTNCFYCESGEYYKIYGFVDEEHISTEGAIYIRLTPVSEEIAEEFVIEAAPCTNPSQDERSNEEIMDEDYAYIAYIYKTALPAGEYKIEIITEDSNLQVFITDTYIIFSK